MKMWVRILPRVQIGRWTSKVTSHAWKALGTERYWFRILLLPVQGSNSGRSRLCFTIFTNSGYDMRFIEVGSLRQFRSDGNPNEENQLIEELITRVGLDEVIQ